MSTASRPAADEIVAFVDDNLLDFPRLSQQSTIAGEAPLAPFGSRHILLPNLMYGSWQPR